MGARRAAALVARGEAAAACALGAAAGDWIFGNGAALGERVSAGCHVRPPSGAAAQRAANAADTTRGAAAEVAEVLQAGAAFLQSSAMFEWSDIQV